MSRGRRRGPSRTTELRVQNFSLSLDGYAAGPRQSLEHPLGGRGAAAPPDVPGGRAAGGGRRAVRGRDVGIGGGASTVQQYLRAGLLDELHLVVVPVLLGDGERLLEGLGDALQDWRCVEFAPSETVAHVVLRRTPSSPAARL